jgi:hypothetical protein
MRPLEHAHGGQSENLAAFESLGHFRIATAAAGGSIRLYAVLGRCSTCVRR